MKSKNQTAKKTFWLGLLLTFLLATGVAMAQYPFQPVKLFRYWPEQHAHRVIRGFSSGAFPVGDQNSDGHPDIGVNISGFGGRWTYIFFGGINPDTLPDRVLSARDNIEYGEYMPIGDVSGDGIIDFLRGSGNGTCWVLRGGGEDTTEINLFPENRHQRWFPIGDVNGDGIDDLLLQGSWTYQILVGGGKLDSLLAWSLLILDSLRGAWPAFGDLNGNGSSDVVISEFDRREDCYQYDRLYVVHDFLTDQPDTTDFQNRLPFAYYRPGNIYILPDITGDRYNDLLVSLSLRWDVGDTLPMFKLLLFPGGEEISDEPLLDFPIGGTYKPANIGDVNGDGYCDLGIANHYSQSNWAQIFLGGPTIDDSADAMIVDPFERFGYNGGLGADIMGCGDFNANGIDDVVVLCYPDNGGGHSAWVMALDRRFADISGSDALPPSGFFFYPPYPNPFNNITEIRFDLMRPSDILLSVYSLDGRMVEILADHHFPAGSHNLQWQAGSSLSRLPVASGLYLICLSTSYGNSMITGILIK